MVQEEYSKEGAGEAYHNYPPFSLFEINVAFPASAPDITSRATSPGFSHDDTLSLSGNAPDYPEEVGLYPPFRANDTPSVTGLQGPGTTRVFDVFQENRSERNDGEHHRYPLSNKRKRASENARALPRKRNRHGTSTATALKTSRGRRASHLRAENSSSQDQSYSAGNLAVLRHAMGYLKRAYNVAYAEGKFSDDLADTDDFVKENLAVLQLAIKTLQHAYGIIAISTTITDATAPKVTPVQSQSTVTHSKWTDEDESRLFNLRDVQKLPWSRICGLFPERTPGAVKFRYYSKCSRRSHSSSSKENHPVHHKRIIERGPSIRRSPRLNRVHRIASTEDNAERSRESPSVERSRESSVSESECIDPRLRPSRKV